MTPNIKGCFVLQAIVILTFVLALVYGCNSSAGTIDYRPLYNEQVLINSSLRSQNSVLKLQNDSLVAKVNHLNDLVLGLDKTIKAIYLESAFKIDSLKFVLQYVYGQYDSVTIIMLQSLEDGLENISDESYLYLNELRKK